MTIDEKIIEQQERLIKKLKEQLELKYKEIKLLKLNIEFLSKYHKIFFKK
ncbi:hypothetical protein M0R01_04595 [bacterium]|jgi:hypothetical protein|nr:hypothetical protein [bacterium]